MNNDLISREALKEKFERLVDETIPYGGVAVNDMRDLIDNAPAVEPTCMVDKSSFSNEQYKADIDNAYACGYEKGKSERPQGEWLWLGDNPYSEHKWSCNKCGRGVKEQENFCPNCGADMRGGAE